ncbi:hypothetical protein OESDEN_03394 [Oesophagostomum dentatum]|uniref:Uncharacterized protein n=1 Tax=Oesophagostomum dentatum TaxID=61180 RepID=A0A0B1TGL4_OESDE|nr:hypothetical protein OESDEN_03394 [Oesophagostomum dentatum]
MLRIAKELSESETASFTIFEDNICKYEERPSTRNVHVQTEISCDHVKLSTDLSIGIDESKAANESADVVFWRAVATQRARELDTVREDLDKIRAATDQNVKEKQALDEKHDALYSKLRSLLENMEDVSEPREENASGTDKS